MPEAYDEYPLVELTIQAVDAPMLDVGDIIDVRKPSLHCGSATVFNYIYLLTNTFEVNQLAKLTQSVGTGPNTVYRRRYTIPPFILEGFGVDLAQAKNPKIIHQPIVLLGYSTDEEGGIIGRYSFIEMSESNQHLTPPIDLTDKILDKNTQDFADVGNL